MEAQSTERRKQELITEGFAYRRDIRAATAQVKESLHPDKLAHGAVGLLAKTALGFIAGRSSLGGLGINLHTALPLVMSAVSLLSKTSVAAGKPLLNAAKPMLSAASRVTKKSFRRAKPVLVKGGIAVGGVGVLAAVAAYLLARRRVAEY